MQKNGQSNSDGANTWNQIILLVEFAIIISHADGNDTYYSDEDNVKTDALRMSDLYLPLSIPRLTVLRLCGYIH